VSANWGLQTPFAGPTAKNRGQKLDPNSSNKLNLGLYFLCGPHRTHSSRVSCFPLLWSSSGRP
jgi:hypothetical protein